MSTAELMLKDKHYDSQHIREQLDQLQRKWSTLQTNVGDHRDTLEVTIVFFTLLEEVRYLHFICLNFNFFKSCFTKY